MRLMSREERRRWWFGHWRLGVPALMTLGLVWLMTAPLPLASPAFPHVALLGVFVWSAFQPQLMPPWLAFLIGCVADLLFALPVGVSATVFALVSLFVRLFDARFGRHVHDYDWGVAAIVVVAATLAQWQLMALAGQPGPLLPFGWQVASTILAYPLVVWACAAVQRRTFGRKWP